MKKRLYSLLPIICLLLNCCAPKIQRESTSDLSLHLLEIVNECPGTIGIAFVSAQDTVCINNGVRFPMMSVFKLHQSLAVIDTLERSSTSLDSLIRISRNELDENTWSPMLKDYTDSEFMISVRDLVNYAIISSDNNASNILFQQIMGPEDTDKYIRSIARDTIFSIEYTESQMKASHELSYSNYTSPLAAASLILQVFNDSLCSLDNRKFLQNTLSQVTTGHDRLGSIVKDNEDILFAHKTGSGYRNSRNELIAHNDVGYFRLPDNRDYALAVFIRDFRGTEDDASKIMASVSAIVYSNFISKQQ